MRIGLATYIPRQVVKKVARESASLGAKATGRGVISYGCINAFQAVITSGPFLGLFKAGLLGIAPWSSPLIPVIAGVSAVSLTLAKRFKPVAQVATHLLPKA